MDKTESHVYTRNSDDKETAEIKSVSEDEESSYSFDFDKRTKTSDFTLVVEGKSLHVSKTVLGLASPVFERMFQSDFKENSAAKMDLPDKCYTDILEFLRSIYPSILTTVNRQNVLKILPLADEYQVDHLKSICEKVLLNSIDDSTSAEQLFEILSQASLYDLKELGSKCIRLANAKTKDDLFSAKEKIGIPVEVWLEILESLNTRMAKIISEQEVKMQEMKMELKANQFELESLKLHWSCSVKKSVKEVLIPKINWREETVLLVTNKEKGKDQEKSISIWDIGLKVAITATRVKREGSTYLYEIYDEWLCVEVRTLTKVKCHIAAHYAVLNRYFTEGSLTFISKDEFQSYNQRMEKKLVKMSDVETGDFFSDSKLCIIVNIFMSKPFVPL